ncbi:hypothetical protein [Thiomicrospira microaerophila]|uniref:hypothetical protein n=1 Tax=Thiomicrospira microaerophila TaxID=406020 RepID=UPI0005CB3338|nr:hypothetical protein [Thiomicrospira microaerophila]
MNKKAKLFYIVLATASLSACNSGGTDNNQTPAETPAGALIIGSWLYKTGDISIQSDTCTAGDTDSGYLLWHFNADGTYASEMAKCFDGKKHSFKKPSLNENPADYTYQFSGTYFSSAGVEINKLNLNDANQGKTLYKGVFINANQLVSTQATDERDGSSDAKREWVLENAFFVKQ